MKIGIWLDKEKAHIITLNDGQVSYKTVLSNVEDFRIHGGSGSRLKGGPQDVVQDSKYLERERHQLKKYFNNLVSEIKDANDILLFGPAETGEKFYKELCGNYKDLSTHIKSVQKADSMTKGQEVAWVKDFYKSAF
jgi:hypothetical protein